MSHVAHISDAYVLFFRHLHALLHVQMRSVTRMNESMPLMNQPHMHVCMSHVTYA